MKISKNIKNKIKHTLSKIPALDLFVRKKVTPLLSDKYDKQYSSSEVIENQFLFECFKGKFFNDSPLSLYKELKSSHKGFKFIWVVNDYKWLILNLHNQDVLDICLDNNTTIVKYGSDEYLEAYATSKYWVTNCRVPFRVTKKEEQIFIQCWHGTPLKKMAHDIKVGSNAKTSLDGLKFAYDHEVSRLDYFLSPSSYASKCFCSSFNMDESKILELGYPRNDKLLVEKNNFEIQKQIKKHLGIEDSKQVILYAPTWRDDKVCSVNGHHILTNPLDSESFLSKFKDAVFLYRGHYFTKPDSEMIEFIDVSHVNDINDLFLISDVLITDYSSLFFDFANLEKPIYFYMPDLEEYRDKTRGFYLDVYRELPGPIASNPDELASYMLRESFDYSVFDSFNKKYNTYEDGKSSNRVIKALGLSDDANG